MGKKTGPVQSTAKPRARAARSNPLAAPARSKVKPGAQGDRLDLAKRARAELRRHTKLVKEAERLAARLPGALVRLDTELLRILRALARRFGFDVEESAALLEQRAAFQAAARERDDLRARVETLERDVTIATMTLERAIVDEDTRARELAATEATIEAGPNEAIAIVSPLAGAREGV